MEVFMIGDDELAEEEEILEEIILTGERLIQLVEECLYWTNKKPSYIV